MKQIIILVFLLLNSVAHAHIGADDASHHFFDGTKTIHLKFTDVIDDKYTVDVLWTPDDGYVPRLVGPATIRFVRDGGSSFS